MIEWKPIQSAPKDKRHLLLWVESRVPGNRKSGPIVGRWFSSKYDSSHDSWYTDCEDIEQDLEYGRSEVTHYAEIGEGP